MGFEVWSPEGWSLEGWSLEGWEAQNFALVFPSPAPIFALFVWGLLVEFWWCLKRRGARMFTFGVLGLSCEVPAAPKPPGFHTTAREPKREHLRPRRFKHHQIQRKRPTREGEKERNLGRSGGGRSGGLWPLLAKPHLARISVSKCWPHLAKPHWANFSVLVFWPNFLVSLLLVLVVPCCSLLVLVGACCCLVLVVCVCMVGVQDFWASPLRRTALPLDRPKFRSFFSLPPEISFFLLSLGGLLVECGRCSRP